MTRYTQAASDLVTLARMEARRLHFPFVQREQLFLGMLHDETVSRILESLGLDVQNIRQEMVQRLVPGFGAPDDPSQIELLPTAEQVYHHRAQAAAALLGHTHIGPEDILLGFLLEQHGVVMEVLTLLGATREKIVEEIRRLDTQRGLS